MDLLKKSAEVFKNYEGYNYTFITDCDISITVAFRSKHFYHLIGLHYLTDIVQFDRNLPGNSSISIYKKILKGKISQQLIEKSSFYNKINERLVHFPDLGRVLSSKIIIDFDYTKVPKTELLSKYLLYNQYEDGYSILGLRYDSQCELYVPETFIFEHTDYYVKNQTTYNIIDVTRNYYNW